jgi:hypothetical protein
VTGVTFDLFADNVHLISQTFATAAQAVAYFTNNAIDLGTLVSGPLSANTLSLSATLTVTATTAGSGFYGDIIVGDPPKTHLMPPTPELMSQAMAGFGASSGGPVAVSAPLSRLEAFTLAAPGGLRAA